MHCPTAPAFNSRPRAPLAAASICTDDNALEADPIAHVSKHRAHCVSCRNSASPCGSPGSCCCCSCDQPMLLKACVQREKQLPQQAGNKTHQPSTPASQDAREHANSSTGRHKCSGALFRKCCGCTLGRHGQAVRRPWYQLASRWRGGWSWQRGRHLLILARARPDNAVQQHRQGGVS